MCQCHSHYYTHLPLHSMIVDFSGKFASGAIWMPQVLFLPRCHKFYFCFSALLTGAMPDCCFVSWFYANNFDANSVLPDTLQAPIHTSFLARGQQSTCVVWLHHHLPMPNMLIVVSISFFFLQTTLELMLNHW